MRLFTPSFRLPHHLLQLRLRQGISQQHLQPGRKGEELEGRGNTPRTLGITSFLPPLQCGAIRRLGFLGVSRILIMVVGLSLRKWCEVVRGLGLFEVLGSIILVGGLSSVWCGAVPGTPKCECMGRDRAVVWGITLGAGGSVGRETGSYRDVCVYVCMYVFTYVHMHVCTYARIYVCVYVCLCIYICVCVRVYVHVHVHVHV